MEKNIAEIIVKVYAVLAWIGALFGVIASLGMIFVGTLGGVLGGMMGSFGFGPLTTGVFAGMAVVIGILMLALAVLQVFVGIALWQHKEWARIVTLIFSVLGVLSIINFNLFGFVIGGLGVWLFGFEETVVGLFGAKAFVIGATKKHK